MQISRVIPFIKLQNDTETIKQWKTIKCLYVFGSFWELKICILCFVLINSVILNILWVWILF